MLLQPFPMSLHVLLKVTSSIEVHQHALTFESFTELQSGSITGATVFNPSDFTGLLSLAVGGRCEIFRAMLHGDKVLPILQVV